MADESVVATARPPLNQSVASTALIDPRTATKPVSVEAAIVTPDARRLTVRRALLK